MDGPPLIDVAGAAEAGVERVGGKALGLAQLIALGLPVPPAVVLTTAAHASWLESGSVDDAVLAALSLGEPLAVRSSAVDEDSGEHSAAGQYESVMGVRGEAALRAAIEHCYRAAAGERATAYRGSDGAHVALVIQRQVTADRAGVAFSADPVTGAREHVLVEAVFGHGEGAVAGEVTPDRYRVSRADGRVRARIAVKEAMVDGARGQGLVALPPERRIARTLRDNEARAVAQLALRAEDGLGTPVDIEWCFARGELWAVQCRPITTLARVAS